MTAPKKPGPLEAQIHPALMAIYGNWIGLHGEELAAWLMARPWWPKTTEVAK